MQRNTRDSPAAVLLALHAIEGNDATAIPVDDADRLGRRTVDTNRRFEAETPRAVDGLEAGADHLHEPLCRPELLLDFRTCKRKGGPAVVAGKGRDLALDYLFEVLGRRVRVEGCHRRCSEEERPEKGSENGHVITKWRPSAHEDEAIELFTGVAAGTPDAEGNYPADTIYGRVAEQLDAFDRALDQREV